MLRSQWISAAGLALIVSAVSPAVAIFVRMWEPLPLARLLSNAEQTVKAKPKDARSRYVLGRLHSLGFVRGERPVNYNPKSGEAPGFPPYESLRQRRDQTTIPTPEAAAHLKESVRLYNEAAQLEPKSGLYWLGLGWMLYQGAPFAGNVDWPLGKPGEKKTRNQWVRAAADSLWKAYNLTEKEDLAKPSTGLDADWAISLEAGQTLLEILKNDFPDDIDATPDKERITKQVMALQAKPRVVTPLVFPLDGSTRLSQMVDSSRRVRFDLAGDTSPERWPWLRGNAAFLAWDPEKTGRITSGRQLFGTLTWQMFWRNGFEPLAALDDNRDGTLNGPELQGIVVWHDRDYNGRSNAGEVLSLESVGIVGIRTKPKGLVDGIPTHTAGLILANGNTAPVFDWTPQSVGR